MHWPQRSRHAALHSEHMNEQLFANKICQVLDRGTRVEPTISDRLRAARERALDARRMERAPALAWADNVLGSIGGPSGMSLRPFPPHPPLLPNPPAVDTWQQALRPS